MVDGTGLPEKVAAAGVVGAGGGGFPTAVKLQKRVDTVIVNGAECEPLLGVDQFLMARHAREIVAALTAVMEATGAGRGVIALKEKCHESVRALRECLSGAPGVSLHLLEDVYPVGDEHLLVYAVTGRVIGPGGLPGDAGVVVLNAETAYNVYQALHGRPVTEKWTGVVGAVERPATVKVPLGVPLEQLVELAGPLTRDFVLLAGGPCMGRAVKPGEPVTKTTKAVVVLPADHPLAVRYRAAGGLVKRDLSVCMQCRRCTDLCPRRLLGYPLEPHRIMRAFAYRRDLAGAVRQAAWCSECGICELYACPFGLSPRTVIRVIKGELVRRGARLEPDPPAPLHPRREWLQVPAARLVPRLGLSSYQRPARYMETAWTPREVVLPLQQHAGAVAVPLVAVGEWVREGQPVAAPPPGALGAFLHAGLSGRVISVAPDLVIRVESVVHHGSGGNETGGDD